MNLRLADFSVLSESEGLRTEKRAFFPATWGASHLPVTLMVSKDMALNNINVKNSFALTPIAQFVDQVPSYLVSPSPGQSNTGSMQGKHPNHVKYFHPSPTFSSSPPRRLHLFATAWCLPVSSARSRPPNCRPRLTRSRPRRSNFDLPPVSSNF